MKAEHEALSLIHTKFAVNKKIKQNKIKRCYMAVWHARVPVR